MSSAPCCPERSARPKSAIAWTSTSAFTPATNTLPIRRLGLDVGEEAEIHVAWPVWPDLTLQRTLQRYTRLAEDRYRYRQDEFDAGLTVDRQGLVLEYEGLWRAIVVA